MSDVIEKIKKRIEARKWKITDDAFVPELIGMQYANNMNDWCLKIIDEELAKEPQECNSDLISRNMLIESFNASINTGYETFPFDIIVEAINNQPQVQQVQK